MTLLRQLLHNFEACSSGPNDQNPWSMHLFLIVEELQSRHRILVIKPRDLRDVLQSARGPYKKFRLNLPDKGCIRCPVQKDRRPALFHSSFEPFQTASHGFLSRCLPCKGELPAQVTCFLREGYLVTPSCHIQGRAHSGRSSSCDQHFHGLLCKFQRRQTDFRVQVAA